ncbi:MAG: (d)CMP kinase [Clostridiales bacterium]|nr:(d)CMP kinase [Clostridiales bacterium]MDY5677571.1 (d)CMP kinase [Eubacteriales bacterium]MDY5726402.1 (d)CMP kinase [Eubacteriales bacterium]
MINIAIDGPSGAGKSTIAKSIAARKKITYLDTGAMYRAVGLKVYLTNSDMYDENQLSNILDNLDLDIKYVNGEQKVFLDGKDVSKDIREHHISKLASDVSAIPACRLKLVDLQRRIAEKSDCVLDGRDIGTYVLPDANVKIFLTASPEVRATRRYKELLAKGQKVEYDKVLSDINERDKNDSSRAFAPLKKADDAVEIDSSDMTIEQVIAVIDEILSQKGVF